MSANGKRSYAEERRSKRQPSNFVLSPGTKKILRRSKTELQMPISKKRSRSMERPPAPSSGSAIGDLGKDVPLDIAIRRILILAQRGDWAGCEQALRAVEKEQQDGEDSDALLQVLDASSGSTPLMYAAMENKISLMERMKALGSSTDVTNKENYSVLHLACMYSKPETISFLLSYAGMAQWIAAPAGPQHQNCLHLTAARSTHQQAVAITKELLKAGPANLKMLTDKDSNIALMIAIDAGNGPLCRELLSGEDASEQICRTKGPLRDSILHLAARRRHVDLVKTFTELGCPVDKTNGQGQTCLHIAAIHGDLDLMRVLLMARADASITDVEDRAPIYLAAERGHTLAIEFLTDRFKSSVFSRASDGSTLLHVAALNGHSETAMILHRRGVPLLMPNKHGARGIHVAAGKGHIGVVNAIVARGENVNVMTNQGLTALHIAVEVGNYEVVECLLGHGAAVDMVAGDSKESALHAACRIGEVKGEKCAQMLLKSGADPDFGMLDGNTPLHVAASQPAAWPILRLLLENGANVGKENNNGNTALQVAVKSCNFKAAKALIGFIKKFLRDCRSFVSHENHMGENSMHMACGIHKGQLHFPGEDSQIVKLLLDNGGADCILKLGGLSKETPMHYVAQTGNSDVLEALLQGLEPARILLCINMQSSTGWSPLCSAASQAHLECVKQILKNQGRVDVFDLEGRSPLHLAAATGSVEVCQSLLEAKAFVNSKTKSGWSALHFASQNGHHELMHHLVKHGATLDSLTMKKQSALQVAAAAGNFQACQTLVDLGASLDNVDDDGQKAIHLAAEGDKAEVILMFLHARPSLVSAMTKDGNTCAHIAAKKGSTLVVKELMKFDPAVVISARNKTNDSTALHIATNGGHRELVQLLLEAGASVGDETRQGHTPLHIAARNGFSQIINDFVKHGVNLRMVSHRSGMTALHVAAFYGEVDAMRELLVHVPSHLKSEFPASMATSLIKEFAFEANLTALHLACYAGSDDAVRTLLNFPTTDTAAVSTPSSSSAIHYACRGGHIGVVGLLLSRSTSLLKAEDQDGRTCLHIAATYGHVDMVQVLLSQGASISAQDKEGWLALHCAAQAGFLDVVHLLVENGASTSAETKDGHVALWHAVAAGNFNVTIYLLRQAHDTLKLLKDRDFCYNLMMVGKAHENKAIEDYIFVSASPCYTASLLSAIFRESALSEQDRAADLLQMGDFCEELTKEFVAIAAAIETPGAILSSINDEGTSFIDTMINAEQKIAISQYVVQQYLQEIWQGHLTLSTWQLIAFFLAFALFPPVWFFFSMPINKGLNQVPVVKFMSYLMSHLYFMGFLILVCVTPPDKTTRPSMTPYWYEIVVWVWYLGLFLSQITNPGAKGGLSWVKYLLVALGMASYVAHAVGVFLDPTWYSFVIYIRNMFYGWSLLFAAILILDFLSFHPLFGPWAIIIGELLLDVGKFIVVLSLFIAGYSLLCTSMNLPFGFESDLPQKIDNSTEVVQPFVLFELLFFALFGFVGAKDLMVSSLIQDWTIFYFKLVFASYLLLSNVVLVNLLIAMMRLLPNVQPLSSFMNF